MTKTFRLHPLVVAAGLAFSMGAVAAPWTVVPETSTVGFVGTQQGTKFNGRFQTFDAVIDRSLGQRWFQMMLLGVCATISLLLASIVSACSMSANFTFSTYSTFTLPPSSLSAFFMPS